MDDTNTPTMSDAALALLPHAIGEAEDGGVRYDEYAEKLDGALGPGQVGDVLREVAEHMRGMMGELETRMLEDQDEERQHEERREQEAHAMEAHFAQHPHG